MMPRWPRRQDAEAGRRRGRSSVFAMAAILCIAVSGCASAPGNGSPQNTMPAAANDALTPDQQAAYKRCLQDSMAVAMAWEAIEHQCRERVTQKDGL